MTAPSPLVRRMTVDRERGVCVAFSTKCWGQLEWNHRSSSGIGGRGHKAPTLTPADGVMMCTGHNQALESDPAFQSMGKRMGWKLVRNRGSMLATHIPFFNKSTGIWLLPDEHGTGQQIPTALALELIDAAGGNYVKGVLSR